MFRKVAIALIAASMFAAPVMAKSAASAAKPATTSSSVVKTVKADKTTFKHRKHVRAHHGNRMSQHNHMNGVKHARHFNKGKGHKVAGTSGKVVSTKPATRAN
jgi:Ni/Co efflux regulator RcnB